MRLFREGAATPFTPFLVDSGADYSIFDASVADQLSIDYRTGLERPIKGVGEATGWIHEGMGLALRDPDNTKVVIEIRVAFLPDLGVSGLVGRYGFFEAFKVTIDEVERSVELQLRDGATNVLDWKDVPIFKPAPKPGQRGFRRRRRR